jgi:hypothetical protein
MKSDSWRKRRIEQQLLKAVKLWNNGQQLPTAEKLWSRRQRLRTAERLWNTEQQLRTAVRPDSSWRSRG